MDRSHLETPPHISTFASPVQRACPPFGLCRFWSQDLSQLLPCLHSCLYPTACILAAIPIVSLSFAASAVGRCPGNVARERRRQLDCGKTKGWHIAKCHCKKVPCSECGGLERPRPQGSGLAFSVPCWFSFVRSPSWAHLSIPVELSLC